MPPPPPILPIRQSDVSQIDRRCKPTNNEQKYDCQQKQKHLSRFENSETTQDIYIV